MTRITGGLHTGRRLTVPGAARPTTDRVREAVFNTLSHRIDWPQCTVLDLYAGSGALGLEAISRGARRATLVELDRRAAAAIRSNAAALGVADRTSIVTADAARWRPALGSRFGLVFVDPPYELAAAAVANLLAALVDAVAEAIIVVERPSRDGADPLPPGWRQQQRRYGDTTVWYGRAWGALEET